MGELKNTVPRIRFKNENNKWSIVFLNEIAEINPPSEIPNEFKYVDLESVKSGILLNYRREFKASAPSRAQRLAVNGDIFYQTVRPYQKNNILFSLWNQDYVFSTGYAQLRCNKKINNFFLFSLLETNNFVTEVLNKSTGTSYPSINGSDLSVIRIKMPEIQEQTKIGNFFQKLDKLIELSQTRLEQAKTYKKAMLQKMFPQQGESVSQIRFKGFSGDWRFKKLGQCFSERIERSEQGDLLSVTMHFGVVKTVDLSKIDMSSSDKSNYKKVCTNDIAYNSMRMWQGASGISNYEGIVSPAYTVITPKNNISSLFFSYFFKTEFIIDFFKKYSQGLTSDTWNLKYPALKLISIYCPCIEEQTKIGSFFQKLDQLIEHQTRKLESYQQLKKALLQRMFI